MECVCDAVLTEIQRLQSVSVCTTTDETLVASSTYVTDVTAAGSALRMRHTQRVALSIDVYGVGQFPLIFP